MPRYARQKSEKQVYHIMMREEKELNQENAVDFINSYLVA